MAGQGYRIGLLRIQYVSDTEDAEGAETARTNVTAFTSYSNRTYVGVI